MAFKGGLGHCPAYVPSTSTSLCKHVPPTGLSYLKQLLGLGGIRSGRTDGISMYKPDPAPGDWFGFGGSHGTRLFGFQDPPMACAGTRLMSLIALKYEIYDFETLFFCL